MLKYEYLEQRGVAPEWADDMIWYGPVGIGFAQSKTEYREEFNEMLQRAFSDIKVTIDVLSCEGHFCGAHGHIHGNHVGEFLGEPATGKRVSLRFGNHWHVRDGIIIEGYTMMDFPALFEQFGVDLFSRTSLPETKPESLPVASPTKDYNNNCMIDTQLNPPTKNAPQTFLEECAAWVIKSTDAVWHATENVE